MNKSIVAIIAVIVIAAIAGCGVWLYGNQDFFPSSTAPDVQNLSDSENLDDSSSIASSTAENTSETVALNETTILNDLTAYTTTSDGFNYVILEKNGQKIVVEKAPNDYEKQTAKTLTFTNIRFSSSGNYLIYNANGWEWFFVRIYNIKTKQIKTLDFASEHGFSKDETQYYACANSDMAGIRYVNIYSLPDFTVKKELLKLSGAPQDKVLGISCTYDAALDRLIAELSCANDPGLSGCDWKKTVIYDFGAKKETIR